MNKKQVGALLKVISKDDSRPVLTNAYVTNYKDKPVLVATDGFRASIIYMPEAKELEGYMIRRSALEKWYKLATGKSLLDIKEVSDDDYATHSSYADGVYPNVLSLVPEKPENEEEWEGQTIMKFNPQFFKDVQDIEASNSVAVEMYGKLKPLVVRGEVGLHLVMPMK